MSKKQTVSSFLAAMKRGDPAAPVDAPALTAPTKVASKTRVGLKHIGGYLDVETVEKVAILRARLRLDNSQLIKKAITELFDREDAARKFGDR
ncbi:hypothetical protein [Komagataeibacter sp. FNDCF1]|uniref:hypothetical protein n=1 Tax=Komagataeibacter sp. FNDCF1 TaxID=2878681 RepID=UPI001E38010E|nr:hypothetical protein [Komagataeibacter sp. FNDCF1]MCE2566445.1 hypothetical protein [Komagataeibacter sp. FNDCF1]